VEVLNLAATPLPIDEHTGLEQRLDWRFLDVRRRPAAQLPAVFEVLQHQIGTSSRERGQGDPANPIPCIPVAGVCVSRESFPPKSSGTSTYAQVMDQTPADIGCTGG
jgi:hypothetical protein